MSDIKQINLDKTKVLSLKDATAREQIKDCVKNTDSASDSDIAGLTESSKFIAPSNLKKAVETIGGVLNELTTTDKESYVAAINEIVLNMSQQSIDIEALQQALIGVNKLVDEINGEVV